jgi:hypothetical protein
MDRAGHPYSSVLDRQSNPIAEQGGVYIGADLDVSAKISIQKQNKQIGPSMYRGADNEQVWNVPSGSLLFTSQTGAHGSTNDSKMAVLGSLNGQGAVATSRYAADPRAQDIIRLAVKNKIKYVGVAYQNAEMTRGNVERGVTVQMGGLRTLPAGNGRFGEDSGDNNVIKPGDLLCADVPVPGREGLMPGPGSHSRRGVPDDRYTLQVRRCTPLSSGQNLMTVVHRLLEDEQKWAIVMGERYSGTSAWASAASELFNSYLTASLLVVGRLMAAGLIAPTTLAGLVASTPADSAALVGAAAVGNQAGPISDVQQAALSTAADTFVGHLAELLRVVETREYTGDDSPADNLRASADPRGAGLATTLRTLRMNLLQTIFYSGKRLNFEFGFTTQDAAGRVSSTGRYRNTGEVNRDTTTGRLLEAQLQHASRACAGFHNAILDDLRMIIGKAATGATSYGSGNVHVFLSKMA